MINHSGMRLGKLAPRIDHRTLRLSRYTASPWLVPPKRIDWSLGVNDWGMMLNAELGICAEATAGHMIQAWTTNNGSEVVLSDEKIRLAYSAITGYVPGDPSTDNGSVVLDVLNYWRHNGIGGHKIAGYVAVNPNNRDNMKLACDLFGGVYLGVALPISAQTQEVWSVPDAGPFGDGKPGSWGLHAIPMLNYGPTGGVIITWGAPKTVTWQWMATYCDEAFAILSEDWVSRVKNSPGGLDFEALQADLARLA